MPFLKLLLVFAPWLSFLFIAHGSLFRLKLGLIIALVLSLVMGITRLHRGVILWAGLIFFTCSTVAVAVFENMWTAKYMGILANGALAVSSWITIALKKPFTLDYAREHTDPALWENPIFIRTNVDITSIWAGAFTVNTVLAWGKMEQYLLPEWGYEVVSYVFLVGAVAFSTWYPNHIRRRREQGESEPSTSVSLK
jgi:hypothetical protein